MTLQGKTRRAGGKKERKGKERKGKERKGKGHTNHFWRKWIDSQGAADGSGRGVEGVGEGFVGCYAARGDLFEEGVDALAEGVRG
jgi:hypothetical protein